MATIINQDKQDYFVKLAPDFSVFDLAEKYYYDNNLTVTRFKNVFEYKSNPGSTFTSEFYRAMYLVYPIYDSIENNSIIEKTQITAISVSGLDPDEYVVFPYRGDSFIVIAINNAPIVLNITGGSGLILGVAF